MLVRLSRRPLLVVTLAFIASCLGGIVLGHTEQALSALPQCTIVGTPGNDNITGTNGADFICGEGGDDVINGGNGDDTIDGGPGADDIDGGGGFNDRVFYSNRSAAVTVTLAGGSDDGNADDDNGSRRDNVDGDRADQRHQF